MNEGSMNYQQIKNFTTFEGLAHTAFEGSYNAYCWQRNLEGDFEEIVNQLSLKENITEISVSDLQALTLTDHGNIARDIIINDISLLEKYGASPVLNLLKCYERDNEFDYISTDVYSFHVDRSPVATDTFLCTYYGTSSDIIPNNQVEQKILIPEIREKLKKLHDGIESDFENFLSEYFFDLHYQLQPNAQPINLGNGNLWKLAVDHPDQNVLPCVHRAPVENDGEYRLLLIC